MDIFSFALVFFIVALVAYLFITREKHTKPVPPGPRGWELVRAFFSSLNGTLIYETAKWAHKYGELVFCPLPQGNLLFLNSPSVTKELFAGKATEKFANDRSWSYVADKLCLRKCIGFASPSEPSWTKKRKLLNSMLKLYGEGVAKFEATNAEVLDDMMTTLDSKCGQDIELVEYLNHSLHSVMAILLTGEVQDDARVRAMAKFNAVIIKILNPAFSFPVKMCPILDYIPGTIYTKTRQEMERRKAEAMKIYFEDMRDTREPGSPRGFVDHLLEYQSKEGARWMTDDHAKGLMMDITAAGIITTTHTLNACIFDLLHRQDIIRKIQEEIDRVIGHDRRPALSDRSSCHYTEAVVWESLRYSVTVPLGLDHHITQDIELKGFRIPKGTVAYMDLYVLHKNPDLWTDPHIFKPERFLDQDGHLLPGDHPNRQNILTFGYGKRSCIGEAFSRARIFLYITTLLQQFDLLPPVKEKLLPIERDSRDFGFMLILKPYHCRLRRRQI